MTLDADLGDRTQRFDLLETGSLRAAVSGR
jgi:hypothetical protein